MHYYQHHIGDFIKDTSFLTNEEIGIYLKLLWIYYDTEKPLPNSLFELSMKVNAREQQESLRGILEMFFTLHGDTWHHKRCDKEISHYHQQLETASKAGKASAAKRALNKRLTTVERPLDLCSTDVQPTNNQEPITNNHIKDKQRGSRLAQDFELTEDWVKFCRQERPELIPHKVFSSFKDYWVAQPGQKGVKLDWFATWRNWVRNVKHERPTFAQQAADVARTTVEATNKGPDPALLKIAADREKASPMPDHIRQQINQVLRK